MKKLKNVKWENIVSIIVIGLYLYNRLFVNKYTELSFYTICDLCMIFLSAIGYNLLVYGIRKGHFTKGLKELFIEK